VLAGRVRALRAAATEVIDQHRRVFHFQFPPAMSPDHFASDGFHPHEHACECWAAGLMDLWPPTLAGKRRIRRDAEARETERVAQDDAASCSL
jgi:hypothetical protein